MKNFVIICLSIFITTHSGRSAEPESVFRTNADLVVLRFVALDNNGATMRGLRASDVRVLEDGVEQQVRSFASEDSPDSTAPASPQNIFILFDTSNSMYRAFPQFQDSVAGFIRNLAPHFRVAINTFSRNLTRTSPLSSDHFFGIGSLRQVTAGDQTALYDSLLLTIRDAAKVVGRNTIVVFSNGLDDSSMLSPTDIARVAEDEGIPIYVIATHADGQPAAPGLASLTEWTGGCLYSGKSRDQRERAFDAIAQAVQHTYVLTYTPLANANMAFRKIEVRVFGKEKLRIQARAGYTPR